MIYTSLSKFMLTWCCNQYRSQLFIEHKQTTSNCCPSQNTYLYSPSTILVVTDTMFGIHDAPNASLILSLSSCVHRCTKPYKNLIS